MRIKKIISFLLAVCTVILFVSVGSNAQGYDRTDICSDVEWDMLVLINEARIEAGLAPLTISPMLQVGSGLRALEMSNAGKLSEWRTNGKPWYQVLNEIGMKYSDNCSETRVSGTSDAEVIFNAIMSKKNSETGEYVYKNRLMSEKAVHIGVGFDSSGTLSNVWSLIITDCDGVEKCSAATGDSASMIQTTANTSPDSWEIIIEASCKHGASYTPLLNGMISKYENDKIGVQNIEVKLGSVLCNFDVYNNFSDIAVNSWYFNSVIKAYDNGYFSGTGKGLFSPNASMTRAMFVVVLSKIANADLSKYGSSGFSDVPESSWYTKAVTWASQCGIVGGTSQTKFSPSSPVTREQICVMLKAYIEKMDVNVIETVKQKKFADDSAIAAWANSSVYFCQRCGFIAGDNLNNFNPKAPASRAQVSVIAVNFANTVIK
ncbi:MAG: S-layer homology domain-containing protein [Clostridia bacterium]|nr:S-layer homology domain-containing protein [Clostridia bacterium]